MDGLRERVGQGHSLRPLLRKTVEHLVDRDCLLLSPHADAVYVARPVLARPTRLHEHLLAHYDVRAVVFCEAFEPADEVHRDRVDRGEWRLL